MENLKILYKNIELILFIPDTKYPGEFTGN